MGLKTRQRGFDFLRKVFSERLPLVRSSGYVLDSMTTAAASAWSVRLLTSSYSGPLFRVLKESDSSEHDVYATANGNANVEDMLLFIGNDNGYIIKEYDQIGSNDVNKTGNIQIVNAGSAITRNGVLAPYFTGTGQLGKSAPSGIPTVNSKRTVSSVAKFDVVPNNDYLCSYGIPSTVGGKCSLGGWNNTKMIMSFGSGLVACSGVDTSAMRRHLYTWDQTTHKLFLNGVQQSLTDNTAPALNTSNNVLIIGNDITGSYYMTGTISETIIFSDALSIQDIATLNSSQSTYFGS